MRRVDAGERLAQGSAKTLLLAKSVDETPEGKSTEDDELLALAFEVETEDCFLCVERILVGTLDNRRTKLLSTKIKGSKILRQGYPNDTATLLKMLR